MEESSNGKLEDTRKVDDVEVVLKEVEELKPEQVELVADVVVDENSKLSKEANDGNGLVPDESVSVEEKVEEAEEKGLHVQDAVSDIAVPPVEEVSEPVEAAAVGIEEEIEEKSLPSLAGVAPVVTDVLVDWIEEKRLEREPEPEQPPPPSSSEVIEVPRDVEALPDVASKGIEEDKLAVLEEKVGQVSGTVGKESVEYGEESIKQSDKSTAVGSSDAIAENTGNTPIISLSQRTVQPTSWRSCCGLFEVLRRSNR